MKRRIIQMLFVIFLMLIMCFLVTSCDDLETNPKHDSADTSAPDSDTKKDPLDGGMDITPTQPLDHDHIYELMVLVRQSCGVEGRQAYVCVMCGKQQYETSIDALPHNYKKSTALSVAATCTSSGKNVVQCSTCGCCQEEFIPARGHSWRIDTACDSNTNEIIIAPRCTHCSAWSTHEFRYKIDDVRELMFKNDLFSEFGGGRIVDGIIVDPFQAAPYYSVYHNNTYLLIVRSTKPIATYRDEGYLGSVVDFYTDRGCTVVYEARITITEDGLIQTVPS